MTQWQCGAGRPESLTCSFFTHAEDATPKPWGGTWADLVSILERTNRPRPRPRRAMER